MSEEPGELPKISYDFQAPIGEFGQVRGSYKDLIPLHFFLKDYGSQLAPMIVTIPETNTAIATDNKELRYSVRSDGNAGFVFLHNYQDHAERIDLSNLRLSIKTKNGVINIPEQGSFTLPKEKHAILPFNLVINDVLIRYATVQPMTNFTQSGINYHVFISTDGIQPELYLQTKLAIGALRNCNIKKATGGAIIRGNNNNIFSFSTGSGDNRDQFLVIPMTMAVNAYQLKTGLVFTKETLLVNSTEFDLVSRHTTGDTLLFYPALRTVPKIAGATIRTINSNSSFSGYEVIFSAINQSVKIEQPMPANTVINFGDNFMEGLNDAFLQVDYVGDNGQILLDGQLVGDHFYYGAPWEIGLKRFASQLKDRSLYLYFHALRKDAPCLAYFKDKMPPFGGNDEYLKINSITVVPEYKCKVVIE